MPDGEVVDTKDDLHSVLAAAVAASDQPGPVVEAEPEGDATSPAEPAADAGGEKAAPAADAEPKGDAAGDAKPAEPKALDAPQHWSAKDKEAFGKAPKEIQEWALRRSGEMEADYTKKTQEIAGFKRDWEPVDKMFSPYRDYMKQYGFTNEGLIGAWLKAEIALKSAGPEAYQVIRDVAKGYNLDKAKMAEALGLQVPTAQPQAEGAQPAPQPNQDLQPVLQEINGIKTWISAQQQQSFNSESARVMKSIEDFTNAKDGQGQLLHPHFTEVENDMAQLAGALKASGQPVPSLQELYDKSVWANTSTRQKLLDAQSAATEAQRKAAAEKERVAARAKAEAARKAGKSVTGAPGAGQPPVGKGRDDLSIRGSIVASLEELES